MKKWVIFVSTLFILFLPKTVHGSFCRDSEKVRLGNLANNITTSYQAIDNNGTISFQISLWNVSQELKIVDVEHQKTYYPNERIVLGGYAPNKTYRFEVRTDRALCEDEILRNIYVVTPGYNPYYKDVVCEGVETYYLCQRWTNMPLTHEEFVTKVNTYKEQFQKKEEPNEEEKKVKGIYDYLLDFFVNYYYIIFLVIIVGCSFGIYWYNKKNDLV